MKSAQSRRKYRSSLGFIEMAFRACLSNARDLTAASKALIAANFHAQGLSLAILALEELGKLAAIDGLLFARSDDYKTAAFHKSGKNHNHKLQNFELFPLFLHSIAIHDLRYQEDLRFRQAIVVVVRDWQRLCNLIANKLDAHSLTDLDLLKQKGLYSHEINGRFVAPRDAVDPALADIVHELAWRALDGMDFLLKGENLSRYFDWARSTRNKLSEDQHRELERLGHEVSANVFGSGTGEPSENIH
jgi:AbiV family abortive infection protein